LNRIDSTQHLADIDVAAVRVNLWVIAIKHGAVDASSLDDAITRVARYYDVRSRAVLALVTETKCLAGHEVGASRVNDRVDCGKLVSGDMICCRDAVADVTGPNSVAASTGCKGRLGQEGENEKRSCDGVSDHDGIERVW